MKSHIAIAFLLAVIGAASSQSAGRCDPNVCRLPRCYCGGTEVCKIWTPLIYYLWLKLGFPTGRDRATFRDSGTSKIFLSRDKGTTGQKFLHCPGTKGQRDKLKILPRDGPGF